ncbi:MAG: TonB-dependent receptor [Halioglobus sp.]|nr:TonB-dependent receptor [Halioglobus sp.]
MRNNRAFQISALSAAVASTLISGQSTAAQGAMLEEVVVTATRRSESIQDIPINITALSASMIERDRLTDLSDIARVVPGMTVVDQGPRDSNTLTVRGLSVDSIIANDGSNDGGATVGTYVGEIPLYIDLKLNDMERVEVLMGPQGTLYGAGTMGGAVRYIPNRPQADELTVQARGDVYDLSHSSDVGYESGGTVNIPIIPDTLAFRASVDYMDDPGFIDYNYLVRNAGVSNPQPNFSDPADVNANLKQQKDANTEETWSGRAALRYSADRFDGTLSYYYQDQDIGARQVNHQQSFGTGKYESAHRFLEPNKRKNELLALEMVADLGFAELTSATGYSEYTERGQRDQTDLLLTFEYGYELFPSFSAYTRENADEDTFTQELRLVSTSEGPFNWIVGAFYNDFKNDAESREFAPGYDQFAVDNLGGVQLRPDSLEYYQIFHEDQKETALFGELGYEITDAWQVTVGARWFKYEYEASNGFAFPLLDTVFFGDPQDSLNVTSDSGDVDDDDTVLKFNTSYDFNDDIMAYLTVSEGYRLGASNGISLCPDPIGDFQNVCVTPSEASYAPDKTTNYEIGVHSQFGDYLIVNGAIYYIEWSDVQVGSTTVNGAQPIITNGNDAESTGLEVSSQYFVTPSLSFSGSYAYTDAQLTQDAPGIVGGADAYSGDRLPGSPEHQVYVAAHYELPLRDGSQLNFDWSMSYQSDVLTKVGERNFGESMPSFYLNNISTSWLKDDWMVTLYADNVFDEYAQTGVRADTSFIGESGDFTLRRYYHNMVRPRQVGLKFVYNFEN